MSPLPAVGRDFEFRLPWYGREDRIEKGSHLISPSSLKWNSQAAEAWNEQRKVPRQQSASECRLRHGRRSNWEKVGKWGKKKERERNTEWQHLIPLVKSSQFSQLKRWVQTWWGRHYKHRLFSCICIFNVEPPSYGRELKKYVYKMEIDWNLYLFIANESYKVTALKY